VFAYDLEKIPHAEASGIDVQGGGHIQVDLKNIGGAGGAAGPIKAYIMTHYDAALEIRSQGSIVYS